MIPRRSPMKSTKVASFFYLYNFIGTFFLYTQLGFVYLLTPSSTRRKKWETMYTHQRYQTFIFHFAWELNLVFSPHRTCEFLFHQCQLIVLSFFFFFLWDEIKVFLIHFNPLLNVSSGTIKIAEHFCYRRELRETDRPWELFSQRKLI